MSRRDLTQPRRCDGERVWEGWRLSGEDRAGVRLVGDRGFAFADSRLGDGSAGLSAFDAVQDRSPAAMAHALRSRRRGGGARPAVVPPLLWPAAGPGAGGPRLDLAGL